MFPVSKTFAVACAIALLLVGGPTSSAGQKGSSSPTANPLTSIVQPERGVLEWRLKDRKLLAYAFGTNQFKPYVRELYSFAGQNVLRDSPADHLHHHGLMYAIRINGVNFWEEVNQPGHERHVKLLAEGIGRSASGLPQASFTELVHWVPHGDHTLADTTAAALLVERRTLTMIVDEANEEVALAWHAEFEVGTRTNRVTLHGANYNGLGLRVPAAWDHNAHAQQVNSENTPYPAGGASGTVFARWGAVSHRQDGPGPQVALFARPRGHAGTNTFFAMTEPFTYLAVTQNLDRTPLEYGTGDSFRLDYLVLAYSKARTPAQLEARYQAWAGQLK